jgi:hypothetical protein
VVIIAAIAVVPVVALGAWTRSRARQVLLALCWMLAVGLCIHAVIDMTEHVLSLAV